MSAVEKVSVPPSISVVRGNPTDEELGAIVAVLGALAAGRQPEADVTPSTMGWTARWRGLRRQTYPGPGAWQTYRHA